MGYVSLQDCVRDLHRHNMLRVIEEEIDADQEAAAIVRRVYRAGGPAVLFTRPLNSLFPLLGNLFGTTERTFYIFRDALENVRRLVELRANPGAVLRRPWRYWRIVPGLWHGLPVPVPSRAAPVLKNEIRVSDLPRLRTWPLDGGAYITLPQVYTEDPDRPGWLRSNLGMYRIQLDGNAYEHDREVGLHYQIHRGIGVHQAAAVRRGENLRVHVFVGGPPSLTVAAVMPLPEGVPELLLAGVLGGRNVRLTKSPSRHPIRAQDVPIFADADFCIVGNINPQRKLPEGPFGDHLGYYSMKHDFPVMEVEHVYHRPQAIWPFTTVGRPPQEDTTFGQLVHELTAPAIPTVLPGITAVHAVDAAGVHPLLLAVGSERYTPYLERRVPQELLTQANALLGQGQLSLAKYILIVAREDDPKLDIHDVPAFLRHLLTRINFGRDLHFQTSTTMDTLDYSGPALHEGSKVVMAAVGPPRRELATDIPHDLRLPPGFRDPALCMPGVLAVSGPRYVPRAPGDSVHVDISSLCDDLGNRQGVPLVVVVDDSGFVARSIDNFLWTTFTRSNPAADIHGVGVFVLDKHWGCRAPLVIDARKKPHHAPALEEDPNVAKRVESLAAQGGPLHGLF